MAPMAVAPTGGMDGEKFDAKFTWYVFVCSIIMASGGLMFGYDIGISGGVTSMNDFLEKFFPEVYRRKLHAHENNYCKYDNQFLQLFTSSLYLAAIVATGIASITCRKYGRRLTIRAASLFFLLGVILNAAAQDLLMLILGRIFLGVGVGFANQAVPLFISEIAPAKHRGMLNIFFQFMVTAGILIANLINYWTSSLHPYGWRISLGLAGAPACILCVGSLLVAETPTSLIERGMLEKGKKALKKVRGTEKVDPEFNMIVHACELSNRVKHPFKDLTKRSNIPPLVISNLLQLFQQFTGINAIMFYAPVLFQTIGFKNDASLLSAVITGTVNMFSTLVANFYVDRVGRKFLLLQACVQMFITQTAIGAILAVHLKSNNSLDHSTAIWVVVVVCIYVAGFAWSWGPLGWLVASEVFPLETRTVGMSTAVSTNMLFTFIIAQAFLSMMCHMRAGIFFFFVAWIVLMALFVIFLLPETKQIPIDEMESVWRQHWYWKRFMDADTADSKIQNGDPKV